MTASREASETLHKAIKSNGKKSGYVIFTFELLYWNRVQLAWVFPSVSGRGLSV